MDKIRVPRMGLGRPLRTPDSVGADKAYSNRKIVPRKIDGDGAVPEEAGFGLERHRRRRSSR